MRILILEPYYGGSHKRFIMRLTEGLAHDFTLRTYPARKWKWRMRLAAPCYADLLYAENVRYDLVLCSTFVDAAALRGLGPPWLREVPLLVYFHENQFEYPVRVHNERDFHFALTNMTTALAADSLAFNSRFNLETFLKGVETLLKASYDMSPAGPVKRILDKSRVLPPLADLDIIDSAPWPVKRSGPPVIVWNHRWEHDKGPGEFFDTLLGLQKEGVDFGLIVLGQSFKEIPEPFFMAREKLSGKIIHFGYAESPLKYATLLKQADIIVSTACHEFFGLSVIEGVRAGLRPVLPKRLSYPEIFPQKYLYESGKLKTALKNAIAKGRLREGEYRQLTSRYSWSALGPEYEKWFSDSFGYIKK